MLSHFEKHPTQYVVASVTGLVGGFANFFHTATEILGFVSGLGGAIITIFTMWGIIKTWAKNRAIREMIAAQGVPKIEPVLPTAPQPPPPPAVG